LRVFLYSSVPAQWRSPWTWGPSDTQDFEVPLGAHRLRRAQHPRPRVAQPTFQPDTTPPVIVNVIVLDLVQGSTLTLGVNASDNVGIMWLQYDIDLRNRYTE